MAELQHDPKQERQLIADISAYAYDPLGYVFYNYPWGSRGTPLEHVEPRKWQLEELEIIRDHVLEQQFRLENDMSMDVLRRVIVSGRGPGKSALFGWLSQWIVDCHIGGTVTISANTERQMRSKTFPEFAKWVTMSMTAHWWECDSLLIHPKEWIKALVKEKLKIDPKYWNIAGQNWSEENPDAFAGTHNTIANAVFFDEASGIPERIWSVTSGYFTEPTPFRLWIAYSQGRRNTGAFFNRFHGESFKGTWQTRHLDVMQVEGIDHSVHRSIIEEHGEDSDEARIEVYGQFPKQGDFQLIANDVVEEARNRDERSVRDWSQPLIMGVDPAPRGRTVIRFRQGRDARSIPPVVLNESNNTQIAQKIVDLVNKYDPDGIAVDQGNGTGVIDALKARRVRPVYEVPFGAAAEENREFALLGAELWGKMRDWLPGACIDKSPELKRDLTGREWKWHGREDSKKILKSKEDMRREGIPSPDDGDALALTFYPRLPRRNKRAFNATSGRKPMIAEGLDEHLL